MSEMTKENTRMRSVDDIYIANSCLHVAYRIEGW